MTPFTLDNAIKKAHKNMMQFDFDIIDNEFLLWFYNSENYIGQSNFNCFYDAIMYLNNRPKLLTKLWEQFIK